MCIRARVDNVDRLNVEIPLEQFPSNTPSKLLLTHCTTLPDVYPRIVLSIAQFQPRSEPAWEIFMQSGANLITATLRTRVFRG